MNKEYEIENLKNTKNDDLKQFTLDGLEFICKVVDIYDADTCKIVFYYNNNLVKFNCRLDKIDTPELRPSKKNPDRILEKKAAKKARNRLIQLCTDTDINIQENLKKKNIKHIMDGNKKLMKIKCKDFDKYGRLLVSIYSLDNKYINQILIEEGFAIEYSGGKKKKFTFK
jgi:endonuclease YncB( thermonuclease family)